MTFDHIALYVTDMDRSTAFYEQVLGLARIPEPFQDGLHNWFRISPTAALHIIGLAADVAPHDISHHMAFRTSRFDSLLQDLDEAGILYRDFAGEGKINIRPDGIRQVFLQDPDGYWIEVNEASG